MGEKPEEGCGFAYKKVDIYVYRYNRESLIKYNRFLMKLLCRSAKILQAVNIFFFSLALICLFMNMTLFVNKAIRQMVSKTVNFLDIYRLNILYNNFVLNAYYVSFNDW